MFEFQRIVCATDLSEVSEAAFCHALRIALEGKLELQLVHAEDSAAPEDWESFPGVRVHLQRWGVLPADATKEAVLELGIRPSKMRAMTQSAKGLAKRIAAGNPDLLVVGTEQRHGPSRWLSPSAAEELARESHVPTLFVPGGQPGFVDATDGTVALDRVLLPIAHDPDPSWAAQVGQRLLKAVGATAPEYRTLHVRDDEGKPAPNVDPLGNDIKWQHTEASGNVVDAILEAAETWQPQLIVMATEGHDSLADRLFGSTVERVLRAANAPVLVAPPR